MRTTCGRTTFLHIITVFYTLLMSKAHYICTNYRSQIGKFDASIFPPLLRYLRRRIPQNRRSLPVSQLIWAWMMSFEDHLLL